MLTIGHLTPVNRAGTDDVNSLRVECQRCGDESPDTVGPPTTGLVLTWARNIRSLKEEANSLG